jgi:hypothetical protein
MVDAKAQRDYADFWLTCIVAANIGGIICIVSGSFINQPSEGEMTRQENIRLSNDPSFGVSRPIRLVVLGCSTLCLLAPTVVS